MSTKGEFYVINKSKYSITGTVTYHDRSSCRITFNDLAPGEKTKSKSFSSGAGTKDTWYYDYVQNKKIRRGSKDCAFYAKDESGPVVISIGDDFFKVTPNESGSCVKNF